MNRRVCAKVAGQSRAIVDKLSGENEVSDAVGNVTRPSRYRMVEVVPVRAEAPCGCMIKDSRVN